MDEPKITYKPSMVGQDWHHKNCYGCGPDNGKGLHADFPFDPSTGEVRFTYKFSKSFEGAPGYAHGGVIASILDEAQGVLCFHIGHFVMTDGLHIKYWKALPLETDMEIRAYITAVRARRLYTRASIIHPITKDVHVTSHARWYDMQEKVIRRMFHRSPLAIENLLFTLEENKKRGKEIRKKFKKQDIEI